MFIIFCEVKNIFLFEPHGSERWLGWFLVETLPTVL